MRQTKLGFGVVSVACAMVVGMGAIPTVAQCVPAPSGLVGWWPGDGDADDIQGSNQGVLVGNTTFAAGKVGEAFSFDGAFDAVGLGDALDSVFAGPDKAFSIDAWIMPDSAMTNGLILVKQGDSACSPAEDERQFILRLGAGSRLEFLWQDRAGTFARGAIGTTSITDPSRWFHVAVTYDGTIDANDGFDRISLYVDGVLESKSLSSNAGPLQDIEDGNANLAIGGRISSGGTFCEKPAESSGFDGLIDEVEIFDRVISASEIQAIFSADSAGKCKGDSDGDGLSDADEAICGTNPNNQDTDGDGLSDGTEFDTAGGCPGCPNPNNFDSDGDGLSDGAEVDLACGPDPCDPDSDGDGVDDGTDPTPCDAGVPPEFLEELALDLCAQILALDLGLFNGPNNNANKGRRNSLCNRARNAAKDIANGDFEDAIDKMESLLAKIDGESPPLDWMDASAEKEALAVDAALLIALLLLA